MIWYLYPLTRLDECIDMLGDATIFSILDANSRNWQVEISKEDRDKTAFTSNWGLFRFSCILFRLKNALGMFQQAMDVRLTKVKWQFAFVYLDGMVIFSCKFIHYLGHVICPGLFQASTRTIDAACRLEHPAMLM